MSQTIVPFFDFFFLSRFFFFFGCSGSLVLLAGFLVVVRAGNSLCSASRPLIVVAPLVVEAQALDTWPSVAAGGPSSDSWALGHRL